MSDQAGSSDAANAKFAEFRTGIGYDSHRFAAGGRMFLGGVEEANGIHLVGHSDGDAVAHALTDALLGAAGSEHDIGSLFPDTDPVNKGRDSMEMLGFAVEQVWARKFVVINADVTVVTEHPRVAKFRDAIRESVAAVLGVNSNDVGFKGKTNEGMGWIGRGEGLACIAVVTIALEISSGEE
jgi:2-C-methyl-D-erythritol 2,4-cyclodiphosphate synthase